MPENAGVLSLIGGTRTVEIDVPGGRIAAKAEFLQPGGSVKDRVGMAMIAEAEQRGVLRPGGTIIEATAGYRRG